MIGKNFSGPKGDTSIYKSVDVQYNGNTQKICVPQILSPDDLATTSLKRFILKFSEKIMMIYDAILSEKRIIFSAGLEFSADEIQQFMFSCAQMVSPPLIGVMQKLHPYFSLLHVDFFKDELGYIACVTNPIFL